MCWTLAHCTSIFVIYKDIDKMNYFQFTKRFPTKTAESDFDEVHAFSMCHDGLVAPHLDY